MPVTHWISLLALAFFPCHLASAVDYGVGFHLSHDYGVASIFFANGSFIDIVKIEGGFNYRQAMRAAYISEDDAALQRAAMTYEGQRVWGIEAPQLLLGLCSLRYHLPPWLGGKHRPSQPLVPMLKALKAAAESYLESPISDAEVVAPFPVYEDFRQALRSAFSSISLRMPRSFQSPAGVLAWRACRIGKAPEHCWKDCGEQLILTVEFSRAALTAVVLVDDCCVDEYRRVLHNTTFGLDSLRDGPATVHGKFENSLRDLIRLPMKDGGTGEDLKYLSHLVLLGESAGDSELQHSLKKVLGEHYERLMTVTSRAMTDPTFAASRGVAFDCWDRLNYTETNHAET